MLNGNLKFSRFRILAFSFSSWKLRTQTDFKLSFLVCFINWKKYTRISSGFYTGFAMLIEWTHHFTKKSNNYSYKRLVFYYWYELFKVYELFQRSIVTDKYDTPPKMSQNTFVCNYLFISRIFSSITHSIYIFSCHLISVFLLSLRAEVSCAWGMTWVQRSTSGAYCILLVIIDLSLIITWRGHNCSHFIIEKTDTGEV